MPKSVALSHYNIMNCGRYIWQQTRMAEQDRICLPVPLFHSFGMIVGISSSTVAGSALVLPHEIFNGLAISLIFGIAVSTLLTLVVIPVLYYALYRRRHEAQAAA